MILFVYNLNQIVYTIIAGNIYLQSPTVARNVSSFIFYAYLQTKTKNIRNILENRQYRMTSTYIKINNYSKKQKLFTMKKTDCMCIEIWLRKWDVKVTQGIL